jgi:exopolysaccharide biosynthesis predicted pyruvyltransferase EpsI/predicted O-linked N-acetylglucosamine transferase (SPINDLY family)
MTHSTNLADALTQATALHEAGRLPEAEQFYRAILEVQPQHADANYNIGMLAVQDGKPGIGLAHFKIALEADSSQSRFWLNYIDALIQAGQPDVALKVLSQGRKKGLPGANVQALYAKAKAARRVSAKTATKVPEKANQHPDEQFKAAVAHHSVGRLNEAEAVYKKVIALNPNHAEAHNNLGALFQSLSRFKEAEASYSRALVINPGLADAHTNLGSVLQKLDRLEEAETSYHCALAIKPNSATAHNNLGDVLRQLGRFEEAQVSYRNALAIKPDNAEAHNNLGGIFQQCGRFEEAEASYRNALAINPGLAETHSNLSSVLYEFGQYEEAEASCRRALAIKPDYAEAHSNLANALRDLGRYEEAEASYRRALEIKPDYAEAHNNLGSLLMSQSRKSEALTNFENALHINSTLITAHTARIMAQIPIVYRNEAEIDKCRADYQDCLKQLSDDIERIKNPRDIEKSIGAAQPFYLAYQGRNDRDLQSIYGSLVCRLMANIFPPFLLSGPPEPGEAIRVGIVSGYFQSHSNWKIPIKGWVSQLDRQRFRLFGYYTGAKKDSATAEAEILFDQFVHGPHSAHFWRNKILKDKLHVLIYPEIGMDFMAAKLASLRMAPVQCNSWGHPNTSGYPTLDYYLSSELMEPRNGQDHYTEKLVKLPNLSIYYEPVEVSHVEISRAALGLREGVTIYWSGQSLYKYLPQNDYIYPHIAREVGACQFVFIQHHIEHSGVTDIFRERLKRAFANCDLNADDYVVFLPRLTQDQFQAAIGLCDVFLDTADWSGCNTTLESLAHNLPVVTMPGQLMRSRHTLAILRMMGVTETIANTPDEYIEIAIRLARDADWRAAIKSKMEANKNLIYRDRACVTALEQFLEKVAHEISPRREISALASSLHPSDEIERIGDQIYQNLAAYIPTDRPVVFVDFPDSINCGDLAIWAGETAFLSLLGVTPAYFCSMESYDKEAMRDALGDNGVILLHGGGNFGDLYIYHEFREKVLRDFPDHDAVMFPQTVFFQNTDKRDKSAAFYNKRGRITLCARDRTSFETLKTHFPGTNVIMVPDMAFVLGAQPRPVSPRDDILWLARTDKESDFNKGANLPAFRSAQFEKLTLSSDRFPVQAALATRHAERIRFTDWYHLHIADPVLYAGLSFNEKAEIQLEWAKMILSFGEVVVTDRLHGHILCTLMNIPHVLLDNSYGKLRWFFDSWTHGVANVAFASSPEEALALAKNMVHARLGPETDEVLIQQVIDDKLTYLHKNRLLNIARKQSSTAADLWSDHRRLSPQWAHRAVEVARYIPAGSRILDIGCGAGDIERFLPDGCWYFPLDCVARDHRTIVCDLERDALPAIPDLSMAVMLGVAEYLHDLPAVLKKFRTMNVPFLFSFVPLDVTRISLERRQALTWVLHLPQSHWLEAWETAGFSVEVLQRLEQDKVQFLYRAVPKEAGAL